MHRSQSGFSGAANKKTGYAYANTRIRVLKTRLLTPEHYQQLLKMLDVSEMLKYLSEKEYGSEITELASRYSGPELMEYALNRNLEHTVSKIMGFAVGASYTQMQIYLRKWDVMNAKTLLRGKLAGRDNAEVLESMVFAGALPRDFFEHAVSETKSMEDAKEWLQQVPFFRGLEEYTNLGEMEDFLDKKYFSEGLAHGDKDLSAFLNDEIKYQNDTLRYRARQAGLEDLAPYLIASKGSVLEPAQDLDPEKLLQERREQVKQALRPSKLYQNSVRPMLAYVVGKEAEVQNLRLIGRAKHAKLPDKEIEAQLVI